MINGVSGVPCPNALPYAQLINSLCFTRDFFPCLVGAIKMNETGLGEGSITELDISDDGGHGIMQLTSSYPPNWQDPSANIAYAIDHFLLPDYQIWTSPPFSLEGEDLVRAIAASYNEGLGAAEYDHEKYSNVDYGTTNHYAQRALQHYLSLVAGRVE